MIKVGIVGSAGYTAGELIRILLAHREAKIVAAYSTSSAGKLVSDVHQDLVGDTELRFTDDIGDDMDVVFLCLDHGQSSSFLREHPWLLEKKIIDLSNEFRIAAPTHDFVYGLPELDRPRIRAARHIANPGCFATAIQLGLLPLAHAGLLNQDVHISAITGSTGAGRKQEDSLHFSWRSNNVQVYKPFEHQHLPEIRQSLNELQPNTAAQLHFIPHRGNFTRGILASMYTSCSMTEKALKRLYSDFYDAHPFVVQVDDQPDLKRVVNTNKALYSVITHQDKVLIVTVIDNLLKGASGQAVQNMNLMFDVHETTGLLLKSIAF